MRPLSHRLVGSSRPNEKCGYSFQSLSMVLFSVLRYESLGLFLKIIFTFNCMN